MSIARIVAATACLVPAFGLAAQYADLHAMDSNATAEASITRQGLPDSPKNSCSLWHPEDIGRQTAVPMKTIRYWRV
jgi:hypothetical protein